MVEEFTVKSFGAPDETVSFDNGRAERVELGGRTFWRSTVEPGWLFSRDNASELGTDRCPNPHRLYMLAGRMTVETDDGTRKTLEQGDVALIPPGHDAWVDGDERAVFFEETLGT
ncbi:cupin domain-containing protein [Natronococcus sp. A-GB7]|uniref:cupin domain-containing protein n=1 Tax=Natronococcus sp. A-GB7 TaxID=3037649 RepID=UPI00241F3F0B|nr:cupin domain-containing protein [Natronococcus sp. A-GB7]MDG5821269.1 cupin domain-containing protein [Natronococcus sp. A-GB7]